MRLLREASLLFGAVDAVLTAPFEPAQHPLVPSDPQTVVGDTAHRKLHGRFLQITDLHPDPFYKVYSSPNGDAACHSKSGAAGYYGAEATDCDSPLTLINETFKWIDENLKDSIDFVIWTGDSARHDNDERNPRSRDQVIESNELMVEKFVQVFGKESGRTKDFIIPVVPTYGNNDILPHNVFTKGPNKWTKAYSKIWKKFIPEEQRHGFERGGWFSVEVIPNQLVVFSLNTLYFFDSNAAVDGCSKKSEPGYEHMEWLRIQLQFLRERGMKAIIMGHVPPARTQSKQNWDETCWQKYTLWTHRYRDVIVGSMYGHMNVDHFMLQDSEDIDLLTLREDAEDHRKDISSFGDEFTIQSAQDYLLDLRKRWSKLPGPPETQESSWPQKESKYADKIGGQWGERYSVSHVSPSVVPNYYPTLRVYEYNITGLDGAVSGFTLNDVDESLQDGVEEEDEEEEEDDDDDMVDETKHKKKKKKKNKKKKKPKFQIPDPPSKSSPPGPAYSPQTFTWLGYKQYFANLTVLNNDSRLETEQTDADTASTNSKKKHPKPHPKPFKFELEYDTSNDKVYKLKDLTVRSYLQLAHRVGRFKASARNFEDGLSASDEDELETENEHDLETEAEFDVSKKKGKKGKHGDKKKKKKHRKQKDRNTAWVTFAERAFVGTRQALLQKFTTSTTTTATSQEQDSTHQDAHES